MGADEMVLNGVCNYNFHSLPGMISVGMISQRLQLRVSRWEVSQSLAANRIRLSVYFTFGLDFWWLTSNWQTRSHPNTTEFEMLKTVRSKDGIVWDPRTTLHRMFKAMRSKDGITWELHHYSTRSLSCVPCVEFIQNSLWYIVYQTEHREFFNSQGKMRLTWNLCKVPP